jgi:hypothetical protein
MGTCSNASVHRKLIFVHHKSHVDNFGIELGPPGLEDANFLRYQGLNRIYHDKREGPPYAQTSQVRLHALRYRIWTQWMQFCSVISVQFN